MWKLHSWSAMRPGDRGFASPGMRGDPMGRLFGIRGHARWVVLICLALILAAAVPSSAAVAWEIVRSANKGPSWIYGMGTSPSGEVWAVGNYYEHGFEPLVERWDGTSWTVVEVPETGSDAVLNDVAAVSSTDVWAVGYTSIGNAPTRTLTLHFDGTTWKITRSPSPSKNPFYGENNLYSVTALPTGEAWAVGYRFTNRGYQALILRWSGAKWTVMSVPPARYRKLTSVVARSPQDVWAIGYEFTFKTGYQPMALHWDGSRWRTVRPVKVSTGSAYLEGATITPSGELWAVGYQVVSSVPQPLFQRWDGTEWGIVPSPQLKSKYNFLQAIEAVSDGDVWAAGYRTIGHRDVTFVEHWNGLHWAVVPTPDVPGSHDRLWDIALDRSGALWAGGFALPQGNGRVRTLVLRNVAP
jgi:hypothetical protein